MAHPDGSHDDEETSSHPSEVLRLPLIYKKDQSIFSSLTLPSSAIITSAVGESTTGTPVIIKQKIISTYGASSAIPFDDKNVFLPGDYSLGFIFDSKEIAESVVGIKIIIVTEPITNLMISQILFSFYRTLGLEPSRILKYPVISLANDLPFYKRLRHENEQLSKKIEELSSQVGILSEKMNDLLRIVVSLNSAPKLEELSGQISSLLQTKEGSVRLEDLEKILEEKKDLYTKLTEAEDWIEKLTEKKKR